MTKGVIYHSIDISGDEIYALGAEVNLSEGKITNVCCQRSGVSGIKNGTISELGLFAESIASVLDKLSLSSKTKIKSLHVAMRWPYSKAVHSSAVVPISGRSNKIITSTDIAKVNQQAYSLGLAIEERILYQAIQGYTIDIQTKVSSPLGLYGHKLGVELLLVSALNQDVENLTSAVERSGYRVKALLLAPLASCLAVVPEAAKTKGCLFLDFGFDSTQMLLFKDGILRGLESFSFGSHNLNQALAAELRLEPHQAEEIKLSYGNALANHVSPEQEILLKKGQSYRPVKRKVICAVIENQLQVLFSALKERLATYSKSSDFPEGIIVNGRDASIEGFLESLEAQLGLAAHLAKIIDAPLNDISYSACLGLVKHAISQYPRINLFKLSSYGNIFQKILYKSKELYQEYF